jgi:hypothetical protein
VNCAQGQHPDSGAVLHVRLKPVAHAKSKRLGRDNTLKVRKMQGRSSRYYHHDRLSELMELPHAHTCVEVSPAPCALPAEEPAIMPDTSARYLCGCSLHALRPVLYMQSC